MSTPPPTSKLNIVATEGQLGQHTKQAYAGLMGAMSGQEVFVKGARANLGETSADIQPTSWNTAQAGGAPSLTALRERRAARMAAGAAEQSSRVPDDYVPGSRKVLSRKTAVQHRPEPYAHSAEKSAEALLLKRGYSLSRPRTPADVMGGMMPELVATEAAATAESPPAEKPSVTRTPTSQVELAPQAEKVATTVSFEDILDDVHIPEPEALAGHVHMHKVAQAPTTWKERFGLADPVSLALLLVKQFRSKWVEWEPETLWAEIETRFGFEPHRGLRDRIMALRVMTDTVRFHREWSVFEKVVVVLHGRDLTTERVQDVSLAEIARVLTWARQIQDRDFSDEVLAYIAAVAHEEGLLCLPPPLEKAQRFLDPLNNGGSELCGEIWRRWAMIKDRDLTKALDETSDDVDAVDVQIARMASIAEAARNPNG